jgi:hypothetical protein
MTIRDKINLISSMDRHTLSYLSKKWFLGKTWGLWERLGFHITPNHYYEPIPDNRRIRETVWSEESNLPGLELNPQKIIELLNDFSLYKNEYDNPKNKKTLRYGPNNRNYGPVDIEAYYCMIRHAKPDKIIEIGSGESTFIASFALEKNKTADGIGGNLTSIEPYPSPELKKSFPGHDFIKKEVQDVELSLFESLNKNDILFIDSSHVLKIGGDVQYEYLEILPRLKSGVLIHVHDIFMPSEYLKSWVLDSKRFFTEQYLLQAFLAFNNEFEIIFPGSYMHKHYPELLEKTFDEYDHTINWPSNFWMKRK